MTNEIAELEALAGSLLSSLSPGDRRKLMRRMAGSLARSNRSRIAAQKQSDGTKFEARKKKPDPIRGKGTASFLYPSGGGGSPRAVTMKSFVWESGAGGSMLTGYDIDAGGIRSFYRSKIIKWLPVPKQHQNRGAGKLRRRPSHRSKKMFNRLRTRSTLKIGTDDRSLWVGFTGQAGRVARIHHEGLRDKPSLRAKAVDYPKRELLGANEEDRDMMLDLLYKHLTDGV